MTLTKKESLVLNLIARGITSTEVAGIISTSKRTVDFHLANVYKKLGASNRVQAINEARKRGLLDSAAA